MVMISLKRAPPPHFITLRDLTGPQIGSLVQSALQFKHMCKVEGKTAHPDLPLKGQTLAIMFSKRSTRTRVATETAMAYLGGQGLFLSSQDIQLGVNESLRDTSQVVSSMCAGIMARVGAHREIEELAHYSSVPVINALSDTFHPTQILADLMTMHEVAVAERCPPGTLPHEVNFRDTLQGQRVAWVGDANNIVWEMMMAFPKLGVDLAVATPKGYDTPAVLRETAAGFAREHRTQVAYTQHPEEAIRDSHFIVTDTWVSMGQEAEKTKRLQDFKGYQITHDLINRSQPHKDWKFMHCLPRKQEEVDDAVFYSPQSLVFPEAENRKWTILAVLNALLVNKRY
ncbi:ornithine carbamoyltransferase [Dimargaris cristalligena]|uniref:ornithine carbamoyltransferase n=1 Tax=Dimargaris cristalligena TaxID=215637 RepID=A0A4P9ZMX3_9FUNG|nr:ornithine carbamoyltransferase [Dimargaris cristalligena]|eukprot:RKP34495.1 ornithine carbamoyltransferase [Dimargaris cristalligena]